MNFFLHSQVENLKKYLFDVHIWSNDYNPPHFHILKDDWDVEFFIKTGDL